MRAHQGEFKVSRMTLVVKVSRSGFYHWLKFGEVVSQRALQQQLRDEQIQHFVDSKRRYGATPSKLNWKIINKLHISKLWRQHETPRLSGQSDSQVQGHN